METGDSAREADFKGITELTPKTRGTVGRLEWCYFTGSQLQCCYRDQPRVTTELYPSVSKNGCAQALHERPSTGVPRRGRTDTSRWQQVCPGAMKRPRRSWLFLVVLNFMENSKPVSRTARSTGPWRNNSGIGVFCGPQNSVAPSSKAYS